MRTSYEVPPREGTALPKVTARVSHDTTTSEIHLMGELDLSTAARAVELITGLVPSGQHVVLDLSELEFLDVAGVGALVTAHHQLAASGGSLAVIGVRPLCRQVLTLAGVDGVLQLR